MIKISNETRQWLLSAEEPYISYNVKQFLKIPTDRSELIDDPFIRENINLLTSWNKDKLKNHSRPQLLIHKLALLADLGVKAEDAPVRPVIESILKDINIEGIPLVLMEIPEVFGGSGKAEKAWMLCDFPITLGALLKMGVKSDKLHKGLLVLENFVRENGYGCGASIPNFKGPGRKDDFCPYTNVLAARTLSETPEGLKSRAAERACESLLFHWENRGQKKHFLFGIGTDFMKLKYPYVWYNILHVSDVLSRYEYLHNDKRFIEMINTIIDKTDETLRFKPESIYMVYKAMDFGNKKEYSRLLTLSVLKILKRIGRI